MVDTLQLVQDDEIPALVSLINRAFAASNNMTGPLIIAGTLGTRTTEEQLRKGIAAQPTASYLQWKDDNGDMLGCVYLLPEKGSSNTEWYLGEFCVEPTRQGSGLGRTLLRMAEDWAQERGAKKITLTTVSLRTSLVAWYSRRGYQPTGQMKPFPYEVFPPGAILIDDLQLIVLQKKLIE